MKTYHIISNPVAGKGKGLKNLKTVESVFRVHNAEYYTHLSEGEKDASRIARTLTEQGAREIIALGGDGTLHEVLNGLKDPADCNLGLIPSGTGNDFAEKAGLPLDAEKAAKLILGSEAKPTDYLIVGGARCMNVCGLGMDVDVLERCAKGKLKGKIKYLASLVHSLFSYKGTKVQIESEGRVEEHLALIAAACNGDRFGGGIKICPQADISDEKLNGVIVDFIGGKIKLIKAFLQLLKGKILEYPATTHFLCERLRILPQKPCTIQLDGELYSDLIFEVAVGKGLRFYR